MQNVEWMDGWVMVGYPLDCYDYQSTFGANKEVILKEIITFKSYYFDIN